MQPSSRASGRLVLQAVARDAGCVLVGQLRRRWKGLSGRFNAANDGLVTLTSTQESSVCSAVFPLSTRSLLGCLLPLMPWCRLLGGAKSSVAPTAGLFFSSILGREAGQGEGVGAANSSGLVAAIVERWATCD